MVVSQGLYIIQKRMVDADNDRHIEQAVLVLVFFWMLYCTAKAEVSSICDLIQREPFYILSFEISTGISYFDSYAVFLYDPYPLPAKNALSKHQEYVTS